MAMKITKESKEAVCLVATLGTVSALSLKGLPAVSIPIMMLSTGTVGGGMHSGLPATTMTNIGEEIKEAAQYVALGAVIGGVSALSLQGSAAIFVPIIMSSTGTVVVGVGTIHSGLTAITMAFAATGATSFAIPVVIVGGVMGGSYYAYRKFTRSKL